MDSLSILSLLHLTLTQINTSSFYRLWLAKIFDDPTLLMFVNRIEQEGHFSRLLSKPLPTLSIHNQLRVWALNNHHGHGSIASTLICLLIFRSISCLSILFFFVFGVPSWKQTWECRGACEGLWFWGCVGGEVRCREAQ